MNTNNEFIEIVKWEEFHDNGQIWIDGQVACIKPEFKDKYDFRKDGYYNEKNKETIFKGLPVVRIGIWTRWYENGQIGWKLDFADGLWESKIERQKFPSYRSDGTLIHY